MSRRHRAEKREINPDPKFGDMVVTKFMNSIMYDGKKSGRRAHRLWCLRHGREQDPQNPVEVFHAALENVAASGSSFPPRWWCDLPGAGRGSSERRQALAIRWLIAAARNRNETTMVDRLSGELLDAANNRGTAVKKREDTHRMADANRAFSHYRW
jgi:small subunit ribosomal protein S7